MDDNNLRPDALSFLQQIGLILDEDDMKARNRILEMREVPVEELLDHKGNYRLHPTAQKKALKGILKEVGIVDTLLAWYSEREGNRLTLLDGHMRKDIGIKAWPTVILDINDEEADKLIMVLDPIAALAEVEKTRLEELMNSVQAEDPDFGELIETLRYNLIGDEVDASKYTGLDEPIPANDRTATQQPQMDGPQVKVIQLQFEDEQYQRIITILRTLSARYGTKSIEDTIVRLVMEQQTRK